MKAGLAGVIALGLIFSGLGIYFTYEGFAHRGPGLWTFGTEETGEFKEMLPEMRYRRQCLCAGGMFLLFGVLTLRETKKTDPERE